MSEQGPNQSRELRATGPSLWVVAVEFDKIALAVGLCLGMIVMIVNTFMLEVDNLLVVFVRSLLTFALAWLAVFALLFAFRQYTLRQLSQEGQHLDETVGNDEDMQSNEPAS